MKRRTMEQGLKQIICMGMVLIVLAPILLTLFAAFKTKADMVNTSPLLLPPMERITLSN
ncbi:MAG: carbohydrate ABC transporter permease, partial [Lacrimispora sphenoides]